MAQMLLFRVVSALRVLALVAPLVACLGIVMPAQAPPRRQLLIVVDGLRPDYVTPEVMPRLTALGKRGVVFERHHAVYPTVTRVNAASFATGAYPEIHGLLGNSVYFPRVDPGRFLDTADRQALSRIAGIEKRLLTAPTLGELLQASGQRMLVVSSGSGGSAFLNNPTLAGGAILHPDFVLPEPLRDDMKVLGTPPGDGQAPGASAEPPAKVERDRYAVDAFLKVGLPRVDPAVTVLWLGALDSTAHAKGLGDAATIDVLRHIDREIGRVEDGLGAAGRLAGFDIWVTSDHGFSTHAGAVNTATLLAPYMRTLADGTPRIVASGGAIYVRPGAPKPLAEAGDDDDTVGAIVRELQRTPGVGAIFTRPARAGALDGHIAGTLSFDVVRWSHDRSAQILFSADWSDAPNAHGIRGTVKAGGAAGHGSASPWDVHNTLIAAGPNIGRGITIDVPSANVDLMPTFLTLLGLAIPPSVQGRALDEAFTADPARRPARVVTTTEHTARTPDGRYAVTATLSTVRIGHRAYRYFDGASVTRGSER